MDISLDIKEQKRAGKGLRLWTIKGDANDGKKRIGKTLAAAVPKAG